ncbi:GB1/RHD3-type guanine nucleotide-binding (G) domain [Phytophthora cactorum]|nr:GB1/RHD3-type guanine nucleotide-binding (G) domain [Phytophthora cactorum]
MSADLSAVRPLPFVLACAVLEKVKTRLVVVAVAGLYRTGKSFLLNMLVKGVSGSRQEQSGFAVGGTVNACTKGIWMWESPSLWTMTPACCSSTPKDSARVDREQTHDTRIFALALLLASNFVYNSRGVIDAARVFPSFMWVVRDFTLQLLDNGKPISSKQYLENALKPTGGYAMTQYRTELRDEFRTSFESLHKRLFGKAKPKSMFGKPLNGAMFVNLAGSYVEALNSGKAPVISSAWSRVVQAQCHDALEDAVERYKAELRNGDKQDDELEVVDNGQGSNAMFDDHGNLRSVALRPELEMIEIMEKDDDAEAARSVERTRLPCSEARLKNVHRLCKRLTKKKLRDIVDGDMGADAEAGGGDDYMAQFRAVVNAEFDSYRQQNAAASMAYCRHVLDVLSRPGTEYLAHPEQHRQKSAMELFRETQTFLQDDLSAVHKEYFGRAVGPSADAAYCEFVSQRVLSQVIQRTESTNAAHMTEVRALEKQMNDLRLK